MSQTEISEFESEAGVARLRLTTTTRDVLHDASGAAVKREGVRAFHDVKANALTAAKNEGSTRATGIRDVLLAKANANPLAAAAIVGGVAWRLLRHPPISLFLVSVGIYSLLRTDPRLKSIKASDLMTKGQRLKEESSNLLTRGQTVATDALHQTTTLSQTALKNGAEFVDQLIASGRKMANDVGNRASKLTDDASELAQNLKSRTKLRVRSVDVPRSMRKVSDMAPPRDAMLLGIAILAVGTAMGLSYNRHRD